MITKEKSSISTKQFTREVENTLWNKIEPHTKYLTNNQEFYYSVVRYADWNQDFSQPRWDFYNLTSVKKTHRMIYRMLKEAFKVDKIYMFSERHKPQEHHYYEALSLPAKKGCLNPEFQIGNVKHKGRFHTNIIMSHIKNERVKKPNSKCKRLFKTNVEYDNRKPININTKVMLQQYNNIQDLKVDLINACIEQPDWVCENEKNNIKTQVLKRPIDVKKVLHYCMKECYEKGTDFTEVVDFNNSDFSKIPK
tara:strand:- start:130 stop:882 length:753 start_codon:yes stop_codon:yes gene_type:complete